MDNMTLEEALAAADVSTTPVNDILMVDAEARTIIVPASEMLFGVRQDMDAERKHFKCPKIVGDNVDLSNCHIYISYVPSKQDGTYDINEDVGAYLCEDLDVDGDYVTFSWKLSGNVFVKAGYIAFAVYAKQADADGNLQTKWHTTFAIGKVLDTLPDGEQIVEKYADVIEQLLNRMDEVEAIVTPEAMQNYVEAYLAENPPSGMTADEKAQLQKNTEDISSLSEEIKNQTGNGTDAGWNITQINLLENIGQYLLFSDSKTGQLLFDSLITSLRNSASGGESEEPENPDATLTSISATYTGGEVTVGTSLSALTGVAVTGTWSDGSTTNITGYVLSGTIAEGENTITVTYEGLTTTFTVTGIAESGGGGDTPTTYTITNSLTNVSTSNTAETVAGGESYTATLTGNNGYNIDNTSIIITMGGVDVTSSVYANGVITIAEVTGNIIIVASGVSNTLYVLAEPTTFDGTSYIDTGVKIGTNDMYNSDWGIMIDFTVSEDIDTHVFHSGYGGSGTIPHVSCAVKGNHSAWQVCFALGGSSTTWGTNCVVTNKRFVINHTAGYDYITVSHINNGTFTTEDVKRLANYGFNGNFGDNTLLLGGQYTDASTSKASFKGTINDFRIYKRLITDAEINEYMGV